MASIMTKTKLGSCSSSTLQNDNVFREWGWTEAFIEEREGITQVDLPKPKHKPYRDVKNLLWIKRNTVYSVALEEWDRTAKLLTDRVDRMEKRSGDLKNEIYQMVGFFTVFQGVVLTAVTQIVQNNDLHHDCKKVWSPVLLTALAWVVTSIGLWLKLRKIQTIDDERDDEDFARRAISNTTFCLFLLFNSGWCFHKFFVRNLF